jgi:hypothetical protein
MMDCRVKPGNDSENRPGRKERPNKKTRDIQLGGTSMRKCIVIAALLAPSAIVGGLLAQTANTAAQAPQAPAPAPYNPGTGDLMNMIVQPHHIKLWLAAKEGNWSLAEYESKEVRSALANVAKARPVLRNQQTAELIRAFTGGPFDTIDAAVKDHDAAKFTEAYASLNTGCNGCHTALNQPQVVIKVPEQTFYPDQEFRPRN